MNHSEHAYLTVILWPNDTTRAARADLLAECGAGLDVHTMRLRVGSAVPLVVGSMARDLAMRAVRAVVQAGGVAFAPTLGMIEALGATHKVREMNVQTDGIGIDLWRDGSISIRPRDIDIIIRATLRSTEARPRPSGILMGLTDVLRSPAYGAGYGFGGAWGLGVMFQDSYHDQFAGEEETLRISNKLDFHTRDGRVFQIDGDKFGFGVLGDQRGFTDAANIDAMCDLFTHLAPQAVVDPYFSLWRAPEGVRRLRLPQMRINRDDPAFAFYSRWMALVYRHLQK